ncbi:MAG: SRPBCC family protein [Polyangiales bacterium]
MQTVRAVVSRDPDACWRAFTDPATLGAWVPGLRKARVISLDASELPLEILFEFGPSLTYSLVYTYDAAAREVTWQPRTGRHDAVAGFARFDAVDGGTQITYGLAHGDGRSPSETALGDIAALVASFARWIGR